LELMTMADSTATQWDHELANAMGRVRAAARAGDFVRTAIRERVQLVRAHALADVVYHDLGHDSATLRETSTEQWRQWAQQAGVKQLTDADIAAVLGVVEVAERVQEETGGDPFAGLVDDEF
jgi:hypothetical protein